MTRDISYVHGRLEEEKEVVAIDRNGPGLSVRIEMPNPEWGLPNNIYERIDGSDLNIVDFSRVTEDRITLYLE